MGLRRKIWIVPNLANSDNIYPVGINGLLSVGQLFGYAYEAQAEFSTPKTSWNGYSGIATPSAVKGVRIFRDDLDINFGGLSPTFNSTTGAITGWTPTVTSYVWVAPPKVLSKAEMLALNTSLQAIPASDFYLKMTPISGGTLAVKFFIVTATATVQVGTFAAGSLTVVNTFGRWTSEGATIPVGTQFQIAQQVGTDAMVTYAPKYYFQEGMRISATCKGTTGYVGSAAVDYTLPDPLHAGGRILQLNPGSQPWSMVYGGTVQPGMVNGFIKINGNYWEPVNTTGPEEL